VAALSGWGLIIARRSGLSPLGTLASMALTGGLGLAIVALKIAIG
jgi:hypothetical protein